LDREGEHHSDGDEIILGLFGTWDELWIEIRWDVFVENLAFTHIFCLYICDVLFMCDILFVFVVCVVELLPFRCKTAVSVAGDSEPRAEPQHEPARATSYDWWKFGNEMGNTSWKSENIYRRGKIICIEFRSSYFYLESGALLSQWTVSGAAMSSGSLLCSDPSSQSPLFEYNQALA
jgi:hypothetical protein